MLSSHVGPYLAGARTLLPSVMAEGLIGLGHLVCFVSPFDRGADVVGRVPQLTSQFLGHGVAGAGASVPDEPAHGQSHLAVALDLDGHLVRGAADAPRLDLDLGSSVAQGDVERLYRRALGLRLDEVHRVVEDALGQGLLAAHHEFVDEPADRARVIARIGRHLPSFYFCSPWHPVPFIKATLRAKGSERSLGNQIGKDRLAPACGGWSRRKTYSAFGFLLPYLERPRLRLVTPAVSSVPRMMW